MKCKCGRELTTGDLNGMCLTCFNNQNTEEYSKTEKLHTGWLCPKCDYVWAIWVDGCENCNQPKYDITLTDGTGTNHADKTRP